ncbi:MAG: hypothetical protein H7Z41_16660 [Cytophagales bacterium]|nr:hypothetical protein [Armatimonadota bacterium]
MITEESSPFAGIWTGEWQATHRNGTMSLTVSDSGKIIGETTDARLALAGKLTGEVTPRGEWTYAFAFGKVFRSGRGMMTPPQDDTVSASFKDFSNGVLEQEGVCQFKKQEAPVLVAPVAAE